LPRKGVQFILPAGNPYFNPPPPPFESIWFKKELCIEIQLSGSGQYKAQKKDILVDMLRKGGFKRYTTL
jgi:hypothetical protein